MSHRVELRRRAQDALDALPANDRRRVSQGIEALADVPRPPGVKKLMGDVGWRIRIGNYRVIYTIWDRQQLVLVDDIKRRTTHTYD